MSTEPVDLCFPIDDAQEPCKGSERYGPGVCAGGRQVCGQLKGPSDHRPKLLDFIREEK